MRRWILLLVLPVGILGGCATQDKEEKEPWTASRWKEAMKEDQERATSEDQKHSLIAGPVEKGLDTIWEEIERIYGWITGDTPFNAAKAMLDPSFPDKRRKAVVYLSRREWGRQEPYTGYYEQMAKADREPLVQSIAVRAMNRSRYLKAEQTYVQLLEDKNEMVRLEAAKALANMPDPAAIDPLIRHLRNPEEDVDVRVACADALRTYRNLQAGEALVSMLKEREFGVAWQARVSLKLMTGKDYHYDQGAWRDYLTGNQKPFG
jgi:hypothetical protein